MPKALENLRKRIQEKVGDKSRAYAIATSVLQKRGIFKKGSNMLTKKGEEYTKKLRDRIKKK